MAGRLFIHAANVHQGGGRSLLTAILRALPMDIQSTCFLDERMPLPEALPPGVRITRVAPSISSRFLAERALAHDAVSGDVVLCFGNLPPLFKLRAHVVVFVQNRYLVEHIHLCGFSIEARLRIMAERFWLTLMAKNVDEFIVQTPSMQVLLHSRTKGKAPISVSPFVNRSEGYARKLPASAMHKDNNDQFLYVASGEAHKNHRLLIDAWCLLADQGLFPSLTVTLDDVRFARLCRYIEQKSEQYRLKVKNVGNIPHERVMTLYDQADVLIYPSTFESLGLPLIEARKAGLPVLASERDYVRDVLDPEQTFDPESAISIARAVKRFAGVAESALPLLDETGFMARILERVQ